MADLDAGYLPATTPLGSIRDPAGSCNMRTAIGSAEES